MSTTTKIKTLGELIAKLEELRAIYGSDITVQAFDECGYMSQTLCEPYFYEENNKQYIFIDAE